MDLRFALRVSVVGLVLVVSPEAPAQPATTRRAQPIEQVWRFDRDTGWADWQPNGQIADVQFERDGVSFRTAGSDPALMSPVFEWPRAANGQHVEIDIDCETAGEGEFYFTNTTQGADGGFNGRWYVPLAVPAAGRRILPVWPFWETLGSVACVRFDPPSGMRCRIYSIRIVGDEIVSGPPSWTFQSVRSSWRSMFAAHLEPSASGLRVQARGPMALITTAVEPFAAEQRSTLRMDLDCPGEHTICFYWASREEPGLWGEPIDLPAEGGPVTIDLRQYPEWKGTITNLAIGFGTYGHETLTLRSLAIEKNDPQQPFLRWRYLGYTSGVGRPDRPAELRALIEHAAGLPMAAGRIILHTDDRVSCPAPSLPMHPLQPGERAEYRFTIIPRQSGWARISVSVNDQSFTRTLRVEPAIGAIPAGDDEVPPPERVSTDYQIGVYYYPGWSDGERRNWQRQADLPERDPLLGWYQEGRPEVADWHIKWAVENGISFFLYDWYYKDGQEMLGAALNEGFLKARYNDRMKFAVMWANHPPFSNHSREQLLSVTDDWIERYLRRPNYLTVDGKPYVSFYSPGELLTHLGSPEAVRDALDAMRGRARAAGLPGLYIAAVEIPGQVDYATLKEAGFDALTAYTYIRTGAAVAHSLYRPYLMGYRAKWNHARRASPLPYIPVLGVGWDGPVWYGPRSERRRGRRTRDLEEGLRQLKAFLDETGGRMALLEAWNEWGEGAYLEPNVQFGFGDLEAVRRTFARPGDWPINVGPGDVGLAGRYDLRSKQP